MSNDARRRPGENHATTRLKARLNHQPHPRRQPSSSSCRSSNLKSSQVRANSSNTYTYVINFNILKLEGCFFIYSRLSLSGSIVDCGCQRVRRSGIRAGSRSTSSWQLATGLKIAGFFGAILHNNIRFRILEVAQADKHDVALDRAFRPSRRCMESRTTATQTFLRICPRMLHKRSLPSKQYAFSRPFPSILRTFAYSAKMSGRTYVYHEGACLGLPP